MADLSPSSRTALATCRPELVRLIEYVARYWPCQVIEGHRDRAAQEAAFARGASQKHWPDGRHNAYPSNAVDVAPLPIDWKDTERFLAFADFVTGAARRLRIPLRWGGDWDANPATPNSFNDLVHFEVPS